MRRVAWLVIGVLVGGCAAAPPEATSVEIGAPTAPAIDQAPEVSPSVSPRRVARQKKQHEAPYPPPDPNYKAPPADMEQARSRFRDGIQSFDEGDYQGALRSFEEAYRLVPNAKVLRNIGTTLLQIGDIERACATFEIMLRADPQARREGIPSEKCPNLPEP